MNSDFNETRLVDLHLYDGLEESPCSGERFLIPSPAGVLEALIAEPDDFKPGNPIAVICHPHPLHGGSMANKVVHIVADSFNKLGVTTLRFNFRGVGHSSGKYDHAKGEVDDAAAAINWLSARYPDSPLWLAGFSFGSYIAHTVHSRHNVERLLLIAPPVSRFPYDVERPINIPWLVIQGGKDDVVSPHEVSMWVHRQKTPPTYEWLADADHFFHGRLNEIRNVILRNWSKDIEQL